VDLVLGPATEVLLADGTTKPIEDVEIGDQLLATDPVTGETGPREVVVTITSQGRKDLVELTCCASGCSGRSRLSWAAWKG